MKKIGLASDSAIPLSEPDSSERPIFDCADDKFGFSEGIVNQIYSFLENNAILPINLAITGEWGSGKSSVINLLKQKISSTNKTLLVCFEPLIEGKLEISDMIELFYSQLYRRVEDKKIREVLKNSLKSFLVLSKFKVSFKINGVGIEKDFGEAIDAWVNIWSDKQSPLFYEQAHQLNKLLKEKNYKLYVIIDEVDRLNADRMLSFLLFSRVLELFDSLTCIIGIDFHRATNKLTKEGLLGLSDYEDAKSYLDKLFQYAFHVHVNPDKKLQYAEKGLIQLDTSHALTNKSQVTQETDNFKRIVNYLTTPREVKKWLIAIKINYHFIINSSDPQSFIGFLAITTKHPILQQALAKQVWPIISNSEPAPTLLENRPGADSNVTYNNLLLKNFWIFKYRYK